MARVQENDQVMVAQDNSWMAARPAVVEYANPESKWVDVRYCDTNEVEQVHADNVEPA